MTLKVRMLRPSASWSCHEVHRPALVGLGRLLQQLWRLPDKAFAWLDVVGRVFTIGKTAINLGCEAYKATT